MREYAFRASLEPETLSIAEHPELMLEKLNASELAHLTGNWTQRVRYRGTEERVVYRTHRGFLAAGAAASLVGVLAVLPLYYGWWRLGRAVSLNPLETAKAFGAPLLAHVNSNAGDAQLAREAGAARVRYGVVEERTPDGESVRLRLQLEATDAGSRRVLTPKRGMVFV
jgi:hypothetical protein